MGMGKLEKKRLIMKQTIQDIIDRHKNTPALIVAHGPSYNDHKERIQEYKNKGIIIFDCNEWYMFQSIPPHYWVVANNEYTVVNYYKIINSYSSLYIYADSVDLTHRDFVNKILNVDYLPYDQRHNGCQPCTPNRSKCCDNIIQGRLTLSEELMKYTGHTQQPALIGSVVLNEIIFAILMGCNPIYITGMDLDYREGYADLGQNHIVVPRVEHNSWQAYAIPNLKIINDAAKNINVKIINLNKDTYFDTFEKGVMEI
jgi:hypothetical protein